MKNTVTVFRLLGALTAAASAVATPPGAATAGREADADVRMIETVRAEYPPNLQRQGVASGEVRVLLEIDARGALTDFLVTAFTRREFAYEAGKAIRAWRFEPARIGGQPVGAVVPLTVVFQSNGVLAIIRQTDAMARNDVRYDYAPCPSRALDRTPELIVRVPPLYPKQVSDRGVTGRVALDFYIDETGRVRFPIAREPADPELAGLAIAALKVWRFEPPTRGGLPVLTRASTSFAFDPGP